MFNSSVLDVAVGLVSVFLAVSLVTSATVEAINSSLKLRSISLRLGIQALLNDPDFTLLARKLYEHAAINPRGSPRAPNRNKPSYIDSTQFANALLDVTGLSDAAPNVAPGAAAVRALKEQLAAFGIGKEALDPQIRQLLEGMIDRTDGDVVKIRSEVAIWFDGAMDRVSGAFKRQTQLVSFCVALAIAIVMNVDTVRVATALWEQPLIAQEKWPDQISQAAMQEADGKSKSKIAQIEQAAAQTTTFLDSSVPVGWQRGHVFVVQDVNHDFIPFWNAPQLASLILGWFATAVAALFGAPFWFDTLQGAVRLKGAGPSPAEKAARKASAP